MKLMVPFTPHIAYECLANLKCKDLNKWPKIDKNIIESTKIKMVVQINGKTRDVLDVKRNLEKLSGDLVIKYYPTKSASVKTLSAHLNRMKTLN